MKTQVTEQVREEILICEISTTEINLKHQDPVNKDLEVTLLPKQEKMRDLQESDTYIRHLPMQKE